MKTVLIMDPTDNVGNAIEKIAKGDAVFCPVDGAGHTLTAATDVPFAFKIALVPIAARSDIVKYGETIGRAVRDIAAGECVHVHNVEGGRGRGDRRGGEV